MFRSIRSRAVVSYLLVALISLVLAAVVSFIFLTFYSRGLDKQDMHDRTVAIADNIERARGQVFNRPGDEGSQDDEQRFMNLLTITLNSQARVLDAKLVVADGSGRLIAESSNQPDLSRRSISLPPQFLPKEGSIIDEREIPGLSKKFVYVSVPLEIEPGKPGFLISMRPTRDIGAAAVTYTRYIIFAALISLGLSAVIALLLSAALTRPIRELAGAARKMAGGDYSVRVRPRGSNEIGELGQDFNLMAERVHTAYEMQRNFVGNVSHELRTPLTSIEGFSQALIDGTVQDEEKARRSLQIIKEESTRMKRILNDLLLLSQIDAGQFTPEKERFSLSSLVDKLRNVFGPRGHSEGIDFQVFSPEREIELVTDRNRLEQVLSNLLENAFKYTDAGDRIILSFELASTGELTASVADTGSGINPENLPHIFERFYRVEKSRSQKYGGVGLGLSLCKDLMESLGGRIAVSSVPGQGTTFTVVIPHRTA